MSVSYNGNNENKFFYHFSEDYTKYHFRFIKWDFWILQMEFLLRIYSFIT